MIVILKQRAMHYTRKQLEPPLAILILEWPLPGFQALKHLFRHIIYIKVLPSLIYIRREQETENCTLPLPMQTVLDIKDQMDMFVEEHLQVAKIWVSYTTFRQMKKLTDIL